MRTICILNLHPRLLEIIRDQADVHRCSVPEEIEALLYDALLRLAERLHADRAHIELEGLAGESHQYWEGHKHLTFAIDISEVAPQT